MPKRPEKDLEPIRDRKVVSRYLQFVQEYEEPIHCLLAERELPFDCLAVGVSLEKLEFEAEPAADSPEVEKIWGSHQKSVERKVMIQFQAQDVIFFADAKIRRPSKDRLTIALELPVWKLQRRNALRFRVMESMNCSVKLLGRKFLPDDLSAGGFSILLDAEEAALFKDGQLLEGSLFEFKGFHHKVDVEVTSHARPRKDGMIRLGLKFTKPPVSLESEIAREAYWFNQRVWGKRI